MKKVLFLIFCVWVISPVSAQLNNTAFDDRLKVTPEDSGRLFLEINTLGFSKDNEYFGSIVDGYTLYGYQFAPELHYRIDEHWTVRAGGWLQKDFGNNRFTTIAPLFSIKMKKGALSTVFGTLEGSLNHRLIEPLYDFERVLDRQRLENGGQIIIEKDGLFFDGWVDWQLMQYLNDPRQEEMTGGISLEKRLYKKGGWNVVFPFQAVVKHKGGQLDINPTPLTTIWNSATGIQASRSLNGFFREMTLSGYLTYYRDMSFVKRQLFRDGSGNYLNVNLSNGKGLDLMLSWWKGHEFISIQGGKIYPSQGVYDPSIVKPDMQLLILRMLYSARVSESLTLAGRIEPYADFGFRKFEWSFGIYLIWRDRFFLGTPRKN